MTSRTLAFRAALDRHDASTRLYADAGDGATGRADA